jgi:hypothetical protein
MFAHAGKFLADLAAYQTAVRENQSPLPAIPAPGEQLDEPKRCPTCGLILPEGSRVCPACVDKGKVLWRILGYLRPYWRQTLYVSLLMLASRVIVEEELRRRYVLPVVRRVIQMRERFEILECRVETDRGSCQFSIRNLRENVLRPQPNRYILTDVDGNRFDIPDLLRLPLASQAQFLAHL